MSKQYIFTLLGGDKRQAVIAKRLLHVGHCVRIYGLGALSSDIVGAELFSSAEKAVSGADVVLLPLPVSRDNANLSFAANYSGDALKLSDIVRFAAKGGCGAILGGVIPADMVKAAEASGIFICDYYKSESLQKKNALPSAEGAVMIAMENTDKLIKGMSVLVCGYGRIGTCLASLLDRMGARVTVMARRDESLCEIVMHGYDAVRISENELDRTAFDDEEYDVIINTVPHVVFTRNVMQKIANKPLYIEVASSPGGIDVCAAREMGVEVIFAPSLPGKYAPVNAGEYIFETVCDILRERGMEI